MKGPIEHVRGSGNVFADLGVANPEQALAKAELARQINQIIAERNLSQVGAAEILGIDQPRVSALSKGRLSVFSLEKMMQFASRLGNEVEITIKPSPHSGIKVADAGRAPELQVPHRHVVSTAVIGGQNINLTVLMNMTYRRQPLMKIDRSGMQPIFEGGLLVA
jgi:predicted XRE-type DNA-binding protein